MSTQTIHLTEALYRYFQAHAYREPLILTRLREETLVRFPESAQMEISPEQGQFMHWLIKVMGAKRVLEIGTFTGYSALWMALALPEDGHLISCDINEEFTSLAQDFWRKAKEQHKIELLLGPAGDSMKELINHLGENFFDFIFIDAEKTEYDLYYENSLLLLRRGGVIAIDNTLQKGRVAEPDQQTPSVNAIRQLNDKLLQDPRVLLTMLPISDGLTLLSKI
jgi:predicted O-methyltransferase YrrM